MRKLSWVLVGGLLGCAPAPFDPAPPSASVSAAITPSGRGHAGKGVDPATMVVQVFPGDARPGDRPIVGVVDREGRGERCAPGQE